MMREAQFLKQNAARWKQYESEMQQTADPDVFAARFIELSDDLAYAKTFYPASNTFKYLNALTTSYHQKIYRNKKEKSSRILSFWQYELPYLFNSYQKQLLYAFLFFLAFSLIGALSAKYDDTFVRLILGDGYVNTTNENIEKGDPFAIYKSSDEMFMFVAIAFNNIAVSFMVFVWGIFFSVGTVFQLMKNGIMVGAFIQYFFQKGLGSDAILAVFIHGTIELSVIVVAGCAGLILGNSFVFPKTYNRLASLQKGGKDALKIIVGLIPFFIIAAFLEGFVTRHYKEMPAMVKIFILASSLILILWYFVIYPRIIRKRMDKAIAAGIPENDNENFNLWINRKLNFAS
jgi:uncharacterized membrane protein SpoIIM required for sporulation